MAARAPDGLSFGYKEASMAKRKRSSSGRSASVQRASTSSATIIEVICSNCAEEFGYKHSGSSDAIVCPSCDHSCDCPDEAQLHRVADLRKGEKTGYIINFVLFFTFFISSFAAMYLAQNPTIDDQDPAMFYGPPSVAGLSCLILLIMSIKYETNRWETYF
jgi:hypothetical protein